MINVVPYNPERKCEIVDLLNLALGQRPDFQRDVAYWEWKHEQNPFGKSIVLVAESDGRIVGIRSFLRWRLAINGQEIEAACPVDTVTHPDFQRRGIFRQLTMAASDEAREIYAAAREKGVMGRVNSFQRNARLWCLNNHCS